MANNNYLLKLLDISESEVRELINGKPISDEDYLNSLNVDERKKVEAKRRQLWDMARGKDKTVKTKTDGVSVWIDDTTD